MKPAEWLLFLLTVVGGTWVVLVSLGWHPAADAVRVLLAGVR